MASYLTSLASVKVVDIARLASWPVATTPRKFVDGIYGTSAQALNSLARQPGNRLTCSSISGPTCINMLKARLLRSVPKPSGSRHEKLVVHEIPSNTLRYLGRPISAAAFCLDSAFCSPLAVYFVSRKTT